MENYGRADSLQNANHCRPTVFVYIEVAFKCMGDIIRPHGGSPLQNSGNFLLDKSPEQMYYIRRAEVRSLKITTGEE